jgi:hypothetical protein
MLTGGPAGVLDQVQPEAALLRPEPERRRTELGPVWDGGSIELAKWILTEANQQAAEIRHEARDQAATSLAGARHEADEVMRRASDQAAATVAAAKQQAAEVRANVAKLSAELGGVAAHVTQNLLSSALGLAPPVMAPAAAPAIQPAAEPVTWPAAEPAAEPEARPAVKPARHVTKPGTGPAAKPRSEPAARLRTSPAARPKGEPVTRPLARPAAQPKGRTRQYKAARLLAIFAAVLVVFALVSGGTEVARHGFRFFVFRSTGSGETGPNGLREDQGPGQPDAPGVHPHLNKP